jgi:hypothetical protein
VRRGHGRNVAFGAVVGLGLVLLVAGVAEVARTGRSASFGSTPPIEDRGEIIAGTGFNFLDPCRPSNPQTTFAISQPVHIGGYFTRRALPSERVVVEYYLDGELLSESTLEPSPFGLECYYEVEPLTVDFPGEWRIVARSSTGTQLAQGRFTVR